MSFPGMALIRAPLRKLRYALKGCPVYFYSRRSIRTLCLEAGLTDYRVLRCASSGYILIGNLETSSLQRPGKEKSVMCRGPMTPATAAGKQVWARLPVMCLPLNEGGSELLTRCTSSPW